MSANADFSTLLKCLASGKKSIEQLRPSAPRQTSALELLVVYCFRILLVYPCALYYGMLILSRALGACPTPPGSSMFLVWKSNSPLNRVQLTHTMELVHTCILYPLGYYFGWPRTTFGHINWHTKLPTGTLFGWHINWSPWNIIWMIKNPLGHIKQKVPLGHWMTKNPLGHVNWYPLGHYLDD